MELQVVCSSHQANLFLLKTPTEILMQCRWSPRAYNRTRRCRNKVHSCSLGVCQTCFMYLGVSCGQTKASAATWILFSACLSLPYHSHPFLGGKVALCATSALSLWQCQAVNTLHWIHWIWWLYSSFFFFWGKSLLSGNLVCRTNKYFSVSIVIKLLCFLFLLLLYSHKIFLNFCCLFFHSTD